MKTSAMQECCGNKLVGLPFAVWRQAVLVPHAVLNHVPKRRKLLIELIAQTLCFDTREPFLVRLLQFRRLFALLVFCARFRLADPPRVLKIFRTISSASISGF